MNQWAAIASYVAVLDARAPSAGSLAEVWFDRPIPFTFHGVFAL
jgi:carotenoid cleavage dioxygenase-like enzyme